jgi:branched-chain amino acid transport system substrate-binding protein
MFAWHATRAAGIAVAFALGLPALGATAAPQGKDAKDVLVVQSAPLSGPMAPLMLNVIAAQQAAVDELNARGGLGGRALKLAVYDDGYDPQRTMANARKALEEDGAVMLFGTVGTAQTAALLPYIAARKVPLMGPYTGNPLLRSVDNRYFFTTHASYADELVKMVRNLVTLHSTRIAVVYQNNELGKGMLPLVQKIIADEQATAVAAHAIENSGGNALDIATRLAPLAPSAVILIAAGPAVVEYVMANKAKLGVPIYTLSVSAGGPILSALGESARGLAVARVTPFPWQATTPLAREYTSAMQRNKLPLEYDTYTGYINARILIECLRRADKPISAKSILQALENNGHIDIAGYEVDFGSAKRHGSRFVEITVIGPKGNTLR